MGVGRMPAGVKFFRNSLKKEFDEDFPLLRGADEESH
jgi:hypothetical protein